MAMLKFAKGRACSSSLTLAVRQLWLLIFPPVVQPCLAQTPASFFDSFLKLFPNLT